MMNDIGIDKKQQSYVIKKMINIAIRATYYIFCCRDRNWDSPDLRWLDPVFFGGVPSYFEALWYPHLYFYRKYNT